MPTRADQAGGAFSRAAGVSWILLGIVVTTVPASFAAIAPPGVRVLAVRGGSQEQRRVILARLPRPLTEPTARLADALRAAAEAG